MNIDRPVSETAPMSDAEKVVAELRRKLPGVTCDAFRGDNLAIFLASVFEPGVESDELDDSGTWKQGAIDLADSVLDAIHAHYADLIAHQAARLEEVTGALDRLVNAKAIGGVRELVAGWNGEGRPDGPYPRHDNRLGATLPKTNCGRIYELDEAMQTARAALSEKEQGDG